MSEGRRRVAIPIAFEFLANMMRKGNITERFVTLEGVPSDARHVGEFVDQLTVYFVFEHESFLPVGYGERLPVIDVLIRPLSTEQRE